MGAGVAQVGGGVNVQREHVDSTVQSEHVLPAVVAEGNEGNNADSEDDNVGNDLKASEQRELWRCFLEDKFPQGEPMDGYTVKNLLAYFPTYANATLKSLSLTTKSRKRTVVKMMMEYEPCGLTSIEEFEDVLRQLQDGTVQKKSRMGGDESETESE